jgi:hypothetical protein
MRPDKAQVNIGLEKDTPFCLCCPAGGLGVFERHVVCASGHGAPATKGHWASERKLQARISSVGKSKRCREKIPKTGPAGR